MFLLKWYREWLSIKAESRERNLLVAVDEKVCKSCETLKQQLEIANYEKDQLLKKILKEPEPVVDKEPVAVTRPRNVPWNVRRQLLEQEDKIKAQRLRDAPKPETTDVADLEKELDVAEQTRHEQGA